MSEQNPVETPPSPSPAPPPGDDTLGRRLREAWHKTVGTWATDEKGTASLVQRLQGFGTLTQEEARRVLADAKKRVEENKAELDRRVDESIAKATALFAKDDVKKLEERIASLEARLKALDA